MNDPIRTDVCLDDLPADVITYVRPGLQRPEACIRVGQLSLWTGNPANLMRLALALTEAADKLTTAQTEVPPPRRDRVSP